MRSSTIRAAKSMPDAHVIRAVALLSAGLLLLACADRNPVGTDPSTGGLAGEALQASAAGSQSGRTTPSRYVVQFRDDVTDAIGLAQTLVRQHGGQLGFVYTAAIKGFSAQLPSQAVAALQRNPNVALIETDAAVSADGGTQTSATWGLDRIDQRQLPLNKMYEFASTGAGVTAYIIDTGIRFDHAEFEGRALFGFDYFGGTGLDCNGHGTHVAGTVGGKTYGVAKQVRLIGVRVLDCAGAGYVSYVVAGIDWIVKNLQRPAVANISLGSPKTALLNNATESLISAGVAVAVAAGNGNTDACGLSPASAPNAMTTGATTSTDDRASYSNFGDCVDWFAPGSGITSASYSSLTGTRSMSGTSMASPHTAGAAALYLELSPGSSPGQVRSALYDAATKGAVKSASSANGHLLYTLNDQVAPTPPSPNQAPAADFTVSCVDLRCTLNDRSTDADGVIFSSAWSFGDGTTAAGSTVSHAFAAAGTYQVTLTVTDDANLSSSIVKPVTVSIAPIALTARGYKLRGQKWVDLRWSGASSPQVDVYRNGSAVSRVPNSGWASQMVEGKGGGTFSYQLCEAGTAVCSAVRTVTF